LNKTGLSWIDSGFAGLFILLKKSPSISGIKTNPIYIAPGAAHPLKYKPAIALAGAA
jgi:hypothetical protein